MVSVTIEDFYKKRWEIWICERLKELNSEPFEEKMTRLTSELFEMFDKSHDLENEIRRKLGAIGYGL